MGVCESMTTNGETKMAIGEMKAEIKDMKEDVNKLFDVLSSIKSRLTLLLVINVINVILQIVMVVMLAGGLMHAGASAVAQQGVQQGTQIVSVHENPGIVAPKTAPVG